jgi:tyrosyl-DNA phosphodiesterase-1
VIIGSVPGRHLGEKAKSMWGHLKLRKVLQEHGPTQGTVKTWPVIGQFSSIGSMGPNKENWLCGEWQQSLSATRSGTGPQSQSRLQLVRFYFNSFIFRYYGINFWI